MTTRTRDASIDLARIIGIIAIVAGHILPGRALNESLFIWHVPFFFFLSGYLWRSGRGLGEEFSKRTQTLLKPYLFWFVVLYVPFLVGGLLSRDEGTQLLAPLYGGFFAVRPFTTFWFVLALFATAIVWRLLERTPVAARVAYCIVALVTAPVVGPFLAQTPLALGTSLLAVVFLALGQLARILEPRLGRASAWLGLATIVVGEAVVLFSVVEPFGLKQGAWGTPIVSVLVAALISWAIILVLRPVGTRLPARLAAAVTTLGQAGLVVVLLHPAVLWVFDRFDVPAIVLFLLALILPWALGMLLLRTPLSGWAAGVPRRG